MTRLVMAILAGAAWLLMAAGTAAQTVTGSGTAGTVPVFTGTSTIGNSPISVSGSTVGIGSMMTSSVNNIVVIDGSKYPRTDAGIQAAINAVADGGMVVMPQGNYVLSGTGACQITISNRVTLMGGGWGTQLEVAASVPNTTDVFCLKPLPTSNNPVQGIRLQDFYIQPASGTPARNAISVDGTYFALGYLKIDHVRIDALGGASFAVINATGQATGTPYTTNIEDSLFSGAINLTNAGDSVNLKGNVFTGSGGITVNLIGATVQPTSNGGAHGFLMEGNNISNTGGIYVANAWQGTIQSNNIEVAKLAEANNSCVDIDGNISGNVENFKVTGNFLACSNGINAINQVRINRATMAIVDKNEIIYSNGYDEDVTSNAIGTQIFLNRHVPSSQPITTWLSDSGTKTCVSYVDSSTYDLVSTCLNYGTNTSANRTFGNPAGTQWKFAANLPVGFSSGNDVLGSGLDTAFSRLSAGKIAVGNGVEGDYSGAMQMNRIYLTGISQSGKAACIKGDNSIGYCSTQPDSAGNCTCN